MNDHLGTPVVPGACLAYSYGSPVNADSRIYYAILQEIKVSKARGGAAIFSVVPIAEGSWLLARFNYYFANPQWAKGFVKSLVKKQGFKSLAFTVVDYESIPDDAKRGWELQQQILAEGAEQFQTRVMAQGHL